ncbi:MAG: hypothetical protein E7632_02710 [Ruminococcaceae bacterium]|nr:hypothetical protein [Oscillospiraceae bacterium]
MKKKAISMILLMAMLVSLAACGGDAGGADTTAADTSADTTAVETAYVDTLEKRDLGGEEFVIYGQSYTSRQNFYLEEKDGDVCNDAIFKRDLAVEERLNVDLVFIGEQDRADVTSKMQASVLAGSEEYHLFFNAMTHGCNQLTTAGVLYDLRKIPHLTLESTYWSRWASDCLDINGALYFTSGPISYQFYLTPIVMFFNQRLIDEYQLEDPYELVLSGKWTAEKMYEMIKDKGQDVNGDNKMDTSDFYGFATDSSIGSALYTAAGIDTVLREDGRLLLTLDSPESIDLIQTYTTYFGDRTQVINDVGGKFNPRVEVFEPGRAIFLSTCMINAIALREMKDDFGILPLPKYTEEQEHYYSTCNTFLPSGVAVPKYCSDPDRTGLVMETMAAYSYDFIRPATYEVTLQGKVSRDDETIQMLDIIFEGASYNFIGTFNLSNVGTILTEAVTGDEKHFASKYASYSKKAQAQLDEISGFANK